MLFIVEEIHNRELNLFYYYVCLCPSETDLGQSALQIGMVHFHLKMGYQTAGPESPPCLGIGLNPEPTFP